MSEQKQNFNLLSAFCTFYLHTLKIILLCICNIKLNIELINITNEFKQNILSEEGFEPSPTEVDCDLNAAP